MIIKDMLKALNPQQQEALLHTDGPVLVLAGAGSGKTRVITYRFAYLAKKLDVPPSCILAMTFTNKAADEMRQRIEALIGKSLKRLWIGTFHATCSRILRHEIGAIGFRSNFAIYDEADQGNLLRSILKDFKIHEALYKNIAARISTLKASLIGPEELLSSGDGFGFDEKLAKIYLRYQDELRRNNALDFDDLIMHSVRLFEKHPHIAKKYQKDFTHIMVDEFQDTNTAQYKLAKLLAARHRNICAVGDDDQSIYKFRGANLKNILEFEKDFPDAKVVKLEQNYRSTQNILDAAWTLISKNPERKAKKLWTDKGCGERIQFCCTQTEEEEARYIAKSIKEIYLKGKYSYSDFAVLYRVNQQSRAIEEAMRQERLPYHIIGGVGFYSRREIKDILAYLRVIANSGDSISLKRIINCPPRGIGETTIVRVEQEAKRRDISLFEAMKAMAKGDVLATGRKERLKDFVGMLNSLLSISERLKKTDLIIEEILRKTGYINNIEKERLENLNELIAAAKGTDLGEFLDRTSLFTGMDETHKNDSIALMTLHCAKGLEFPVVFISGTEEGLIPHVRSVEDHEELQEERRLLYVGMTRAKDMLVFTSAKKRRFYANVQEQEPSRFIKEIPESLCCRIDRAMKIPRLSTAKVKCPSIGPFSIGTRVKHPKWGIGVIREYSGKDDELKVMVNFPDVGAKKLALKFANLEKLQGQG